MDLNKDQLWTLVIGILFGLSELMGMFKRGPNGILHGVWKFYNLKVELEYGEEEEDGERVNGNERANCEERVNCEERANVRVEQTLLPDRETIVLENGKAGENVGPNVLLISNKN